MEDSRRPVEVPPQYAGSTAWPHGLQVVQLGLQDLRNSRQFWPPNGGRNALPLLGETFYDSSEAVSLLASPRPDSLPWFDSPVVPRVDCGMHIKFKCSDQEQKKGSSSRVAFLFCQRFYFFRSIF